MAVKSKIPVLSEHEEQVKFITYCRNHIDKNVHSIFAVPNGGKRSLITAIKLKAEGVTSGIPDLFLPYPKNNYHGLFIEMKKSKGGVVSEEQRLFMQKLISQGYQVKICRGCEQAILDLETYLQ